MPTDPLAPALRTGNTAFATSIALLIIRLALGWVFIYHGSQKLFGAFGGLKPGMSASEGMEMFAQGVKDLPLLPPMAWAYMAACGEFFGGIAVFVGLLARLGAIPILVTMLVAIGKFHGPNGFSMGNGGYEYNVTLIAMAAAILIAGPGLISVDAFLFRRGLWARGPQPLDTAAVPVRRS